MKKNANEKLPIYKDPSYTIEERINDLLPRMTVEEKLVQMGQLFCSSYLINRGTEIQPSYIERFFKNQGAGGVENRRLPLKENIEMHNMIQKWLVEESRLGIPTMFISEALHGYFGSCATTFPCPIALACSFNPENTYKMGQVIGREGRAEGNHFILSPNLDLGRDHRWGRTEETYGEDPYLVSRMGVGYVKGVQGDSEIMDDEHMACCVKHYFAHGSPEGGVNLAPVHCGERELRELYLQSFKAAITEGGALGVMPAYSEVDGVPCHGSHLMLRKILRDELKFKGMTFADYGGVEMLYSMHCVAHDAEEAAIMGVEAGVNMEAGDFDVYDKPLLEAVRAGRIDMKYIDEAVSNILRVKFRTGAFDRPYSDYEYAKTVCRCDEYKKINREITKECMVLLKNEGNLLPLRKDIKSVAVIGPNADYSQCGDYCAAGVDFKTILQSIREIVSPETVVNYAQGCTLAFDDESGIPEAVEAAKNSEYAIVVVGDTSYGWGDGWAGRRGNLAMSGEMYDSHDIKLTGAQQKLIDAVYATGTPTIVVLENARPLAIPEIAEKIPAILEAWTTAEEGGMVAAEILFGDINPSGKLSVSFAKHVGQMPIYYNYKRSARGYYHDPGRPNHPGRDYVFLDTAPLFPFGHGLSYTTFEYSDIAVSNKKIGKYGRTLVSVTVKNTGKRSGCETVMLFVTDVISSTTTPIKALKGFERVNLEAGESKRVTLELGPEHLWIIDRNMEEIVEPGEFIVEIGGLYDSFYVTDDNGSLPKARTDSRREVDKMLHINGLKPDAR